MRFVERRERLKKYILVSKIIVLIKIYKIDIYMNKRIVMNKLYNETISYINYRL